MSLLVHLLNLLGRFLHPGSTLEIILRQIGLQRWVHGRNLAAVVWFLCEFHVQSLRCITGIISLTLGNDKTYNCYETECLSLCLCGEVQLSAICRCPLAHTWLYLDKFLFSVHNSVGILQIHARYSDQSSANANHTKLNKLHQLKSHRILHFVNAALFCIQSWAVWHRQYLAHDPPRCRRLHHVPGHIHRVLQEPVWAGSGRGRTRHKPYVDETPPSGRHQYAGRPSGGAPTGGEWNHAPVAALIHLLCRVCCHGDVVELLSDVREQVWRCPHTAASVQRTAPGGVVSVSVPDCSVDTAPRVTPGQVGCLHTIHTGVWMTCVGRECHEMQCGKQSHSV